MQTPDCSLAGLHAVIQTCMGWHDCHLHEFEIGAERFGDPLQWNSGIGGELDVRDEGTVTLSDLASWRVKKFRYTYDMGDSWAHVIQLEKLLPAEPDVYYPRCTAGKRACPPEDCGGPWGYADFVAALQDPADQRHDELSEWVGADFDPEAFDVEAVNRKLR